MERKGTVINKPTEKVADKPTAPKKRGSSAGRVRPAPGPVKHTFTASFEGAKKLISGTCLQELLADAAMRFANKFDAAEIEFSFLQGGVIESKIKTEQGFKASLALIR